MEELRTFIWRNGRAEATSGYNDDLVMAWSIGLFLRDTAMRFSQTGRDLARASMNSMTKTNSGFMVYSGNQQSSHEQWHMQDTYGNQEDISWLL